MILGTKKGRIAQLPSGAGFWLPIGISKNVKVNCLYAKGTKVSFEEGKIMVVKVQTWQCFLVRMVVTIGDIVIWDRVFDGVPKSQLELYTRDCEVYLVA
jgi:hypothetical protein